MHLSQPKFCTRKNRTCTPDELLSRRSRSYMAMTCQLKWRQMPISALSENSRVTRLALRLVLTAHHTSRPRAILLRHDSSSPLDASRSASAPSRSPFSTESTCIFLFTISSLWSAFHSSPCPRPSVESELVLVMVSAARLSAGAGLWLVDCFLVGPRIRFTVSWPVRQEVVVMTSTWRRGAVMRWTLGPPAMVGQRKEVS